MIVIVVGVVLVLDDVFAVDGCCRSFLCLCYCFCLFPVFGVVVARVTVVVVFAVDVAYLLLMLVVG